MATTSLLSSLWRLEREDPSLTAKAIHEKRETAILGTERFGGARNFLARVNRKRWLRLAAKRNPYERALSCYLDKLHDRPSMEALEPNIRKAAQKIGFPEGRGFTFRSFLEAVAGQHPLDMNGHWRPQVCHLLPDAIHYDVIIELRDFETGLKEVARRLGVEAIPAPQPRPSRRRRAHARLLDFYDERCVELVRDIYARDFEALAYGTAFPPSTQHGLSPFTLSRHG